MAGDDRYGRVDEMEQEVQCRGEMTGAQEQNNRRGGDRENQDYQDSGSCQLQAKVPVERYRRIGSTCYPRIGNDASGRRNMRSGEKYPCAVTSEKWRQMYKENEDAKERERG